MPCKLVRIKQVQKQLNRIVSLNKSVQYFCYPPISLWWTRKKNVIGRWKFVWENNIVLNKNINRSYFFKFLNIFIYGNNVAHQYTTEIINLPLFSENLVSELCIRCKIHDLRMVFLKVFVVGCGLGYMEINSSHDAVLQVEIDLPSLLLTILFLYLLIQG